MIERRELDIFLLLTSRGSEPQRVHIPFLLLFHFCVFVKWLIFSTADNDSRSWKKQPKRLKKN